MKRILSLTCVFLMVASQCYGAFWVKLGGPAVSAASLGYSDDFTGTTVALATHDSNWLSSTEDVANLKIDGSGHAIPTADYSAGSAYYDLSTSDVSQIVLKAGFGSASVAGMGVRMSLASPGYRAAFYQATTNWAFVIKDETGNICFPAATFTNTADHTVKLTASGSNPVTLTVLLDDITEIAGSCTDSTTPLTSGHPGFFIHPNGDRAADQIDDWQDY